MGCLDCWVGCVCVWGGVEQGVSDGCLLDSSACQLLASAARPTLAAQRSACTFRGCLIYDLHTPPHLHRLLHLVDPALDDVRVGSHQVHGAAQDAARHHRAARERADEEARGGIVWCLIYEDKGG